jgi:hypothetical protein
MLSFKIENITTPSVVHDDELDDYSISNRPSYTSISPGANKNNSVSAPATLTLPGSVNFKLTVTELPTTIPVTTIQPIPHPTNVYEKEVSIQFVDPIYYGMSPIDIGGNFDFTTFTSTADKLIKPYYIDQYCDVDYGVSIDGSPVYGYLYFAYPNYFATDLTEIRDPNGYIIHDVTSLDLSSFEIDNWVRDTTFGSPYQQSYTVYKTKLPTTLDGPSTFKFKF